jgi:hypothetical protein
MTHLPKCDGRYDIFAAPVDKRYALNPPFSARLAHRVGTLAERPSAPLLRGFYFPSANFSPPSRALSERDLRRWPSQTCGPISGNRRLEVIDPGDVLDDVLAGLVLSAPDVLLG